MDITEKILEQIAHHRAEILRLESALEVIAQVSGKPIKKDAPLITIRRTVPAAHDDQPPVQMKPKRASPKPGTMKKRSMQLADNRRARITLLTALKADGPALSRDLAVTIGFKAGEDIQPVYQRLYELKREGLAEKGDDSRYSVTTAGLAALADVVQEEAGTAAEASEKAA
jgi:hypothetical protein